VKFEHPSHYFKREKDIPFVKLNIKKHTTLDVEPDSVSQPLRQPTWYPMATETDVPRSHVRLLTPDPALRNENARKHAAVIFDKLYTHPH